MENFVVSARKYRPATFNTVVGQSSITNTLKNAIRSNHLAQAFLFCGPRGVGKTTCARILAKTINCFNVTSETEACDQCESCVSFNQGGSLNIYELDAASNNSVDDIRNLVDQVRFAPQLGKFKIYIIDEVHMLTTNAFNAFLKTLEEPPAHAIFILATTEKHKIIPTILSRCQIFDFNRIQIEDIANQMAHIAKSEGITADPDALHIIAQKADGALRDACSIFDQIVSFAGNHVTYKAVIDNLNILDYDYYFRITDRIMAKDISSSLMIFNEILNNGFDGHNFIGGLSEHFRNLLVCKDEITIQLLEVGANIRDKYREQSKSNSIDQLLELLNISNKCDLQYRNSRNQRLLVELALMQMCSLNNGTDQAPRPAQAIAQPNPGANKTVAGSPAPKAPEPAQPVASPASNVNPPKQDYPKVIEDPAIAKENTPPAVKKPIVPQEVSLKDLLVKKKPDALEEAEAGPEKKLPETYYTKDQLLKVWDQYAEKLRQEGKESLYITLSKRKPELKENYILEFEIDNKVQEDKLKEEKTELLAFIRRTLNNFSIDLNTVIVYNAVDTKPYTAQDKYKRLVELNPDLNKLRQQLDLDVEY